MIPQIYHFNLKMMVEEYKIMNISDGTDSKFGAIVIVKANPVTDTGFGKQFTPYIYANILTFFFPANQHRAIRQLVQIANGGGFWQPNLSYDFQQEFIWDESAGEHKQIFRHKSFFPKSRHSADEVNGGHIIQLVANKEYKVDSLFKQYTEKGWTELYTFGEYVESLAENDENTHFWQYLFGTSEYSTYLPIDLPSEYYSAYKDFIKVCSNKDLPF